MPRALNPDPNPNPNPNPNPKRDAETLSYKMIFYTIPSHHFQSI